MSWWRGSFLTNQELLPNDAGARIIEYEYLSELSLEDPEYLAEYPQLCSVVYERQLDADTQAVKVSVAGPGARLKVYLHEDGGVIGAMGNWRDVQIREIVPIRSKEDTRDYFEVYRDQIAVNSILGPYDEVLTDLETATQAYFEFSGSEYQTVLIPIWIFNTNYYLEGEHISTNYAYVPAVDDYTPPIATITEPAEETVVDQGETVTFACSRLENFGQAPFVYHWESDVDGVLSTQPAFATSLLSANCPSSSEDCIPDPHIITLAVTDKNGLQYSESIELTVEGPCGDCVLKADMNADGIVNLYDLSALAESWLSGT